MRTTAHGCAAILGGLLLCVARAAQAQSDTVIDISHLAMSSLGSGDYRKAEELSTRALEMQNLLVPVSGGGTRLALDGSYQIDPLHLLFTRAQARHGLGKFRESERDFAELLRLLMLPEPQSKRPNAFVYNPTEDIYTTRRALRWQRGDYAGAYADAIRLQTMKTLRLAKGTKTGPESALAGRGLARFVYYSPHWTGLLLLAAAIGTRYFAKRRVRKWQAYEAGPAATNETR